MQIAIDRGQLTQCYSISSEWIPIMKAVVNNKLVESVNTNCREVASTNSILIIEAYRPSFKNCLKRKLRRKHIQKKNFKT